MDLCEETTLVVTAEDVCNIETATRNQSKSTAWFMQRAGRITACILKNVCSTDPGNPSQSLIRQICYPDLTKFQSEAINWGCEHEGAGRASYIEKMKISHINFECKGSGLVVNTSYPFFGATPDGVLKCDCCGEGVLEVKCPFCVRNDDPSAAPYLASGILSRKHAYYYQVQAQLFACNVSYADFVVCTFHNREANIITERILPDDTFIQDCLQKASIFLKFCILPELMAKWYSRVQVMPDQTAKASVLPPDGEYIYCYCKQDCGGEMVGCDNEDCKNGQWFHLACLKLKVAPRSNKWYCPNCRLLPQFSRKRPRKGKDPVFK